MFDKIEFKDWAKKNIILLEVDFPRRSLQSKELKAQNSNLQKTFKELIRGYPTGVFAQPILKEKDVQFSVIGSETTGFSLGYVRGGAKTWISEANKRLKKLNEYLIDTQSIHTLYTIKAHYKHSQSRNLTF